MIHDLKTWPEFFARLWDGSKTFELRKDDRGFSVGDRLKLREWNPESEEYSGREETRIISHILRHDPDKGCAATFGLLPGYASLILAD